MSSAGTESREAVDRDRLARYSELSVDLGIRNLRMRLEELASVLLEAVRRRDSLNCFLLAAGMSQIAEDYMHPSPLFVAEVSEKLRLARRPRLEAVARAVAIVARAARENRLGARGIRGWQRDLEQVVLATAEGVAAGGVMSEVEAEALQEFAERLKRDLARLPWTLRRSLVRIPAGFHAFDQEPADLEQLIDRFAGRWSERRRPLLVIGVRTTGCYFAPLCAAFLRKLGYRAVESLTVRPGHPFDQRERRKIRSVGRRNGAVLLVDDPPGSGGSLDASALMLDRLGLGRDSVVLLFPMFGRREELPPLLEKYQSVLLPDGEWVVHSRLTPPAARKALAELLSPDVRVRSMEPMPLPARAGHHGHERALFRARLLDARGAHEELVLAEGVGLGYFGEHALVVARELAGYVPEIHGLRDGILFRTWLPEKRRLVSAHPGIDASVTTTLVQYVDARSHAFAVDEDRSRGFNGEVTTYEVVASILARAFGRAWPLARLASVDRATGILLRPFRSSVVDGNTALSEWFVGEDGRRPLAKVGFADRSFWHLGLCCFDPCFDLAGVDPGQLDASVAANLRATYEQISGERVDAERWLLYQLAHLWGRRRTHPHEDPQIRRRMSRAVQQYFAEILLVDVQPAPAGPLCALDLDGVVETSALGFPATTFAGALALRALRCHGFRPILVSGRSASEISERCLSYGLAGGVAEYGAVVYEAETCRERSLLTEEDRGILDALREVLAAQDGIQINADYRRSVRAYRSDGGISRGLTSATVDLALSSTQTGRIRAVRGDDQTDFTIARIDKEGGLRALLETLAPGGAPIALAVGDTVSDLPMLALAEDAVAPASADEAVRRAGVEIMKRPAQAGLALAVARHIGHAPGGCEVCRAPSLAPRTRLLLEVLSAQERGRVGMVSSLLRLSARVRRW